MQRNIKNSIYLGLLASSFLLLGGCRKVISLDLNSAEKKYVIEGTVAKIFRLDNRTKSDTAWVKISQTKDFNASNAFVGISGASVTISDNGGPAVALTESATGVYGSDAVVGEVGHTYTLSVTVGGQTFSASSKMPDSVTMRKLYIENMKILNETKKVASIDFVDPVGKGNAYRFVQYRNGVAASPIFVQNDDLTDGNNITTQLNSYNSDDNNDDEELKAGDVLIVEMQCIAPPVYKFWSSLNVGATGSGQTATPANPVTNISGGAMGFFSAHTSQLKSLIVR